MVSIMAKNLKNSDTVLVHSRLKLKCCFSFSLIFTDENSVSQFSGKIRKIYIDVCNCTLFFDFFFA